MRDFIKENLRIELENLLYEVKENFNELPSLIRSKITKVYSKDDLKYLSIDAKKLAEKYYDTFGGINDGTGTYTFKITKLGNGFIIKSDMGKDDREYRLGQEGKSLRLTAKAYTSQDDNLNFKDSINLDIKNKSVFSPIVDAKIKLLADDESIKNIIDFDFEGSYTADTELEKNKELSTQKTNPEVEYKRNKFDLDKKNNPDFKSKYVTSIDSNPKIDTLKKDLANNIRFLNTAKNIKQDYINKKEPIKPELEERIKFLESKISDLTSELDNYGK
jgi:hypothetical protein